jgi:hypothetical protein
MKLNNRTFQSCHNTPVYDCGRQSERNERPMGRVKPLASVSHPRHVKAGTLIIARATRSDVGTIVSPKDRYRLGV